MSNSTAVDTPVTYRKTKTGEWVAYGPADQIVGKTTVYVTKRDGSQKPEYISRTGKTFPVDGVEMAYGYISHSQPSRSTNWAPRSCAACQDVEDAGDANGCRYHRGNPRN